MHGMARGARSQAAGPGEGGAGERGNAPLQGRSAGGGFGAQPPS